MRMMTYGMLTLAAAVFLTAGCQESDSQQIRRAQLVGYENLQLKKEIQEKNNQIKTLEEKIASMAQEHAIEVQQSADANFKLLQITSQTAQELEACKAENEKLRQQLSQQPSPEPASE